MQLQPAAAAAASPPVPVRRGKVLEASEMGRSRRHGGGEQRGAGGGGVAAAAAFAALLLGCVVMALVGGAAAQDPGLPSDYKTLSGNAPHPSLLSSLQLPPRVPSRPAPAVLLCFASCIRS